MKKVISSFSVLCLILALVPAVVIAVTTEKGTTRDCTWRLTGTVLTISGKGKMHDYSYSVCSELSRPWGNKITKVKIKNGVTSIGSMHSLIVRIFKFA